MACRSGCPTQDHENWGACTRAANLQVQPDIMGAPARRGWDGELKAYADARRQGLQPSGTTMPKIRQAVEAADA
ncbi:hypothetical protein Lesp01_89860 [Lentzea sp. NBRC 102530]|nr:hypothetical protein Lesp01_89860 [Lentzea sp. NBRC 102530]